MLNTGRSTHTQDTEQSRISEAQTSSYIPSDLERRGQATAIIISTLLLRIAGRISFVLLGFYLGTHFTSATAVALVLEAFYVTELLFAPPVGSFSDRKGRRPFLLAAPLVGCVAALCFMSAAFLFPRPNGHIFTLQSIILLFFILVGRLLEGTTTALNTPASLGYITDITTGANVLRGRVMTAFEVATVGGLVLAIPLGGRISSAIGIYGFFVVVALHLLNAAIIARFVKERPQRDTHSAHGSLFESIKLLGNRRVFTFLPAWLCINALVGAWITLGLLLMTYPDPAADIRHPGQLLYGGFSLTFATLLLGGFGLVFLLGMGLWTPFLSRLRRTTIMLIGLGGLIITIIALTFVNSLAENPTQVSSNAIPPLLVLVPLAICGVMLLSGFTPASLTQMAAISETLPGKRGAVMGLYSIVLGVGQLLGASLGGVFVDRNGFYGLMSFSVFMGLCSLGSVLYMRFHRHDCIHVGASTSSA